MKKILILLLGTIGVIFISGCVQNRTDIIMLNDEDISARIKDNQEHFCYNDIGEYPKILGKHSKNGLTLIEECFCSDYCPPDPEVWSTIIVYEDISSEEKCAEIGGRVLIDAAWKSYIGCAPNISS